MPLEANLDDTGGEVGTAIQCQLINYSSSAYSNWLVEGVVITDDTDGDGTALFANR